MTDAAVKPMPVGTREDLTAADLKASGSTIVKYASWGKAAIKFLFGSTIVGLGDAAVGGGQGATAVLDGIDTARATSERFIGFAAWGITPAGIGILLGVGALVGLYYLFNWIIESRVNMARQPNVIR
jgi:hypothetical protein